MTLWEEAEQIEKLAYGKKRSSILAEIESLTRKLARSYLSLDLVPASRQSVLHRFPPKFKKPIADHITYYYGAPSDAQVPQVHQAKVVGYAADDHLEALVVEVDGKLKSPDGRTFHITLSLDPGHREAVEANKVVESGWKHVTPFNIEVKPTKEPL